MMRTHTCGELRKKHIGKKVSLCGWVHKVRDFGNLLFFDVRDRYGRTQIVVDDSDKKLYSHAKQLHREDVVRVKGRVKERKDKNQALGTGDIEILCGKLEILNNADTLPIEVYDENTTDESRLKYRYLDLRRPELQSVFITRHKVTKVIRDFFNEHNFIDIETPFLAKSTPEGARDFLVPSRIHPGKFYALPQSPQLYKQILMISGFDRYYQIVKCLRDEDFRADRQPEFTQLDIEMSFVEEDDVQNLMEELLRQIWKDVLKLDVSVPFPRLTYREAMDTYGTDRPDTRFGLQLMDVTSIVQDCDFQVFSETVKNNGSVKCISAENKFSRKDIDELTDLAKRYGARGLVAMRMTKNGFESNILKFFSKKIQEELAKHTKVKEGGILFFVADHKHHVVNTALGALRLELGKRLELIDDTKYNFLWITDFPLVEFDENEQRHVAVHHPFTSPKQEDINFLDKSPEKARARAYDVVLNGYEVGGGSIRIHDPKLQERIFKVLKIPKKEARENFGFLLDAFKYGAPPHGGIAFGLDRLVTIITGQAAIRDVIAFPKTKNAESLMVGSPSQVNQAQLDELHIQIKTAYKDVFNEIRNLLIKDNIKYKEYHHKPVYTSEQAAKIRGTKLEQGAKALIFKTSKGYIMVVISAAKKIDSDKLKKILKVEKLQLANAKEVKKITGLSIGAMPPFGNLFDMKAYVDESLEKQKEIVFNAGSHTNSIKMKYKDWEKVVKPLVRDFYG
ncbi:aspartate--tRNA ligase [Candidatus Woesearchaeota archaeon]|nr:aspartate--tRNA ligase [Candidatus Woesearchaeota archaeon]